MNFADRCVSNREAANTPYWDDEANFQRQRSLKAIFLQTPVFLVVDRNVFEMTEKNKSFRSECLKI